MSETKRYDIRPTFNDIYWVTDENLREQPCFIVLMRVMQKLLVII